MGKGSNINKFLSFFLLESSVRFAVILVDLSLFASSSNSELDTRVIKCAHCARLRKCTQFEAFVSARFVDSNRSSSQPAYPETCSKRSERAENRFLSKLAQTASPSFCHSSTLSLFSSHPLHLPTRNSFFISSRSFARKPITFLLWSLSCHLIFYGFSKCGKRAHS
jgi:hypothetical protein